METAPSIDDAIQYIVGVLRDPTTYQPRQYGYEVYLRPILRAYCHEVEQMQLGSADVNERSEQLSPMFYDALWELARRGIIRPGLTRMGYQSTTEGASGEGFTVTASGRQWLADTQGHPFLPMEPGRFASLVGKFRPQYGDGFFQRSQEAVKCHFATSYLACCVMCGAAAESILLKVATIKTGDEAEVLRKYKTAQGRSQIENLITGQLRDTLKVNFKNLVDLIKYWRDEAAHGTISTISESEAYEALARLLRVAHFVEDNWTELTS